MLGCGQPAGESGYNLARVVAVLAGMDHLPGVTVNRYCSSSLQTTRMAMHAIRAGEGDVFLSAGVETVSRYPRGKADGLPDTQNPLFAAAQARTAALAAGGGHWADPRTDGAAARRLPRHGADRGERRAADGRDAARTRTRSACAARTSRRRRSPNGFWEHDITPVTLPDGTRGRPRTTARAPASRWRRSRR